MKLMLISLAPCEIIRTLTWLIALKTCPAMPLWPRMSSPTRQTSALWPSIFTSAILASSAQISGSCWLLSTDREMLASLVDTISITHLYLSKTSKTALRYPWDINMRLATTSMIVSLFLAAILLKGVAHFAAIAVIFVPSFSGFREFSTQTGMLFWTAGSMVAG